MKLLLSIAIPEDELIKIARPQGDAEAGAMVVELSQDEALEVILVKVFDTIEAEMREES